MAFSALNRRQRLFCESYLALGDATKAYIEAYAYPDVSGDARRDISKRAAKLLSYPHVRDHLNELRGGAGESLPNLTATRSRPTAAIAKEAIEALNEVSASDVALLDDIQLRRLESAAHVVQQMAITEVDVRRGLIPRSSLARSVHPEVADDGEQHDAEEHAAALLELLQNNHRNGADVPYALVRGAYNAMVIDSGWRPLSWQRVSRQLLCVIGLSNKRSAMVGGARTLIFTIPAAKMQAGECAASGCSSPPA
jgi:hypothetical protein